MIYDIRNKLVLSYLHLKRKGGSLKKENVLISMTYKYLSNEFHIEPTLWNCHFPLEMHPLQVASIVSADWRHLHPWLVPLYQPLAHRRTLPWHASAHKKSRALQSGCTRTLTGWSASGAKPLARALRLFYGLAKKPLLHIELTSLLPYES